jgi:hypothetical protein
LTRDDIETLTRDEIGVALRYWRETDFDNQPRTQEQLGEARARGDKNQTIRKNMRSRWEIYQRKTVINKHICMTLLTLGFDAPLEKMHREFQRQCDEDPPPQPRGELAWRVQSARRWFRWGRSLHRHIDSGQLSWDLLSGEATTALRWYRCGWSENNVDRLSREYGHGRVQATGEMLAPRSRTDRARSALRQRDA